MPTNKETTIATDSPKTLSSKVKFSRPQLLVFVAIFALIGGYILFRAFAASPLIASIQAEQLVLPSGGSIITDSAASAGKAVRLSVNGTASGTVNFPSSVTSMTVIAKGSQCRGAPTMNVALDGSNLLSGTAVSAIGWTAYTYTPNSSIAAGNHTLSISFTNDNSRRSCSRDLYLDVVNFYGPEPASSTSLTLFSKKSSWKYFDKGQDLGTTWRTVGYGDSTWASGNGILGFGDSYDDTSVSYGSNSSAKYPTTYFRKAFTVTNPSTITSLALNATYDDGFVVYLNGTEVARASMPSGTVTYSTYASDHESDSIYNSFNLSSYKSLLLTGANTLAVEVHQVDAGSSDFSWDAELTASTSAPTNTLAPTVSLSASPNNLTTGSASTLTWGSANATSCAASGAWSGGQGTSGSLSTGALNQTSTYNLSCSGAGGSVTTNVTISVANASTPPPASGGATGDYYVSPSGSDSNPGTSSAPFKTIQKAASVVGSGKVVIVMDGTYTSAGCGTAIFCPNTSNVTFRAQNRWKAVLDGQNKLYDGIVMGSGGSGVTIDGFEIKNFANNGSASGVTMYDAGAGAKILNNNIHDIGRICTSTSNGQVGVEINVSNVTVDGNYIHDIGRLADGEQGCSNSNSNWQNHDHGMYVDASGKTNTSVTITNNFFKNMKRGWAIQVYPGTWSNLQINNNKFVGGNPYRNYSFIIFGINISSSSVNSNVFYDTAGGAPLYNDGSSFSAFTISGNTVSGSSLFGGSVPSGITVSNNSLNANIPEPTPLSY